MAGAAVMLTAHWRRESEWVPLVLLLPGVVTGAAVRRAVRQPGDGPGALRARRWFERRDRWAVVALCLAALTKESTLLVPLALLLAREAGGRRACSHRSACTAPGSA